MVTSIQESGTIAEQAVDQKTGDPDVYLNRFRNSNEYIIAFDKFKNGKVYVEEYENEMRDLFEDSENARQEMIRFARTGPMLKYDVVLHSANNPLLAYFGLLKDYRVHPDRHDAISYDSLRAQYHDSATNYIKEKFRIPKALSVGMVQLMAIDKGLESFGLVEESRLKRLANSL